MLNIFCHIICYDIWFYLSHIILHQPFFYYNIHKIHHKKSYLQLNYKDTHEAHIIENIVQPLGIFVPCFITTFSPLQLAIAFTIISVRGMMRHDNNFSWLIGNHHLLHHKYTNYNYGEYWVDKLYGTLYPCEKEYVYGRIYT
jgi:lathosterol oxidase